MSFRFPAITKTGAFAKDSPFANYVFVSSTGHSDTKLLKLENSRFVDSVLCIPGSAGRWRKVHRISEEEVNSIFSVPSYDPLEPGKPVRVIAGDWQGLEGVVVSAFGATVKVSLELRSKARVLVVKREDVELL